MKHGVEAKNYDDIAKAEHLKPLEVRGDLDIYLINQNISYVLTLTARKVVKM